MSIRACWMVAVIVACGGASVGSYEPPIPPGNQGTLRTVSQPILYSGISDRRRQVIRDQAAWESAWQEMFARVSLKPPRPAVDFTAEMILLAAMGERPNGGYSIHIDGIFIAPDGSVTVAVTEMSPDRNCAQAAVMTQPVHFAVAPKSETVAFAERQGTQGC